MATRPRSQDGGSSCNRPSERSSSAWARSARVTKPITSTGLLGHLVHDLGLGRCRELSRTVAHPPGNTSYQVRMVLVPAAGPALETAGARDVGDDLGRAGDVTRIGEAQVDRL